MGEIRRLSSKVFKNIKVIKNGCTFTYPSPCIYSLGFRREYRAFLASAFETHVLFQVLQLMVKKRAITTQHDLNVNLRYVIQNLHLYYFHTLHYGPCAYKFYSSHVGDELMSFLTRQPTFFELFYCCSQAYVGTLGKFRKIHSRIKSDKVLVHDFDKTKKLLKAQEREKNMRGWAYSKRTSKYLKKVYN